MRNNLQLYHKCLRQVCQWLPRERITRKRNLALLVVGLYLSGAVHLPLIVRTWPTDAKAPSLVNRLHRFLSNPRLDPQLYYRPLAERLLYVFAGRTLLLVIDTTKVGFHHRALVVGLAYRKRTLPLAWSVHPGSIGKVSIPKVIALLTLVYNMVPSNCQVEVTGDSDFNATDLLWWLRKHDWHYVIRQRKETYIRQTGTPWFPIAQIPIEPGQTSVIGWVWLTKTNPFGPTWLIIHWAKGEDKPWILVSDYTDTTPIIHIYRKRMWIEEMYGDMKGHGFDLESTHLRATLRIERLMLGVCIAFVWLITLGSWVVKNGYRHFIDHKSRRDKSYFRLGWDWIERCLRLDLPVRLHFRPYL